MLDVAMPSLSEKFNVILPSHSEVFNFSGIFQTYSLTNYYVNQVKIKHIIWIAKFY